MQTLCKADVPNKILSIFSKFLNHNRLLVFLNQISLNSSRRIQWEQKENAVRIELKKPAPSELDFSRQ